MTQTTTQPDPRMSADYQRKVSGMVQREVLLCLSALVYDHAPDDSELRYPAELSIDDKRECVRDAGFKPNKTLSGRWQWTHGRQTLVPFTTERDCLDYIIDSEGLDPYEYAREVFEHWAVTSWFADKLTAHGETVRPWVDLHVWCRTTTGQSISIDDVVCDIYDDLSSAAVG